MFNFKGSLNSVHITRQIINQYVDIYGNTHSNYVFDNSFNAMVGLHITDRLNVVPNTLYNYVFNPENTNGVTNFDPTYAISEIIHTYPAIISCSHDFYTDESGNVYLRLTITGNYDQLDIRRRSNDDGTVIDDIIIFNIPSNDNYYNNHNLNGITSPDGNTTYYYDSIQSGNDSIHFNNNYYYDASGTLYYLDSLTNLQIHGSVSYSFFPFSNYLTQFGPTFYANNLLY
jgi:hypothetical protein